MVIKYSEVQSVGDVLDSSRHTLYFPNTPAGDKGKDLTLRHGEITLPEIAVGQVQSRPFGWAVAHAGRRVMENTMSVNFLETTGSPIVRSLCQWQELCHGFKAGPQKLKSQYAVNAEMRLYDTTGKISLKIKCHNVWPVRIQLPEFGEESTAAHIHCDFSIDALDIIGITTSSGDYSAPSPIPAYPSDRWQLPRSGGRPGFGLTFGASFGPSGINLSASANFGGLLGNLPAQFNSIPSPTALISKFL